MNIIIVWIPELHPKVFEDGYVACEAQLASRHKMLMVEMLKGIHSIEGTLIYLKMTQDL